MTQGLIFALIIAAFMYLSFWRGLTLAKSLYAPPMPPLAAKAGRDKKSEQFAESQLQRRDRIYQENIENYGTSRPQQEV